VLLVASLTLNVLTVKLVSTTSASVSFNLGHIAVLFEVLVLIFFSHCLQILVTP
jgi:hypothetical protein